MPAAEAPFRSHVEKTLDVLRDIPDREVLIHGEHRVTAGQFHALVHRMAHALDARGVERGETVTLLSGNLPETLAARYAAGLLGCRVNHLYGKLSGDVHAAIVRDVETSALIVDSASTERAGEIVDAAPVERLFVLGNAKRGEDLLELAAEQTDEPFAGRARPEDVCTIRHTGGTTGHPKGICTTFQQVGDMSESRPLLLGETVIPPRQLVGTTLAHAAGYLADATLRSGGTVVLLEDFDAATALGTIERERITHLFLLPPLLYQLLDHPDAEHTDLSSLRSIIYGGCQSSPARIADAVRRLGPILTQFYGQNEAGGISVLPSEDHDPDRPDLLRSAGRVLPGVDVEVRDEAGRPVPNGTDGEICIRSAQIMQGYWKQPELTAEVMRDGWLHTGDVGHLNDEGYLTVVDRLKDMIVVVGGHVYTTELEDVLNSHPEVLQSAVYGVRDEDRMERVHVAIVRAPGATVTEDGLREMVRAEKGAMYEPARIVFVDALPLTDVGKPDKKQLRLLSEKSGE